MPKKRKLASKEPIIGKAQEKKEEAYEECKKIYENTTPVGVKGSASMDRVRVQKLNAKSQRTNFDVFNRYLKFKFKSDELPEAPEAPSLPAKRKHTYFKRNLYDLLKLDPACEKTQISKSYRKLAAVHHPDKGGNPLFFRCLKKTYEILGDDELRELYDNNGISGIKACSQIDVTELESYLNSNDVF